MQLDGFGKLQDGFGQPPQGGAVKCSKYGSDDSSLKLLRLPRAGKDDEIKSAPAVCAELMPPPWQFDAGDRVVCVPSPETPCMPTPLARELPRAGGPAAS